MWLSIVRHFQPDVIYPAIDQIDFLPWAAQGIRLVLLDIDNTLVRHGSRAGDDKARQTIERIRRAGLLPYIVSNAKPSRARQFADSLGVPCVGLSGKPSPRGLKTAMQKSGFLPDQTVMIGDQLFTDVRAARNAQVMAVLVLPVDRHEVWNVAIKRCLEAPLMQAYRKNTSLWPLGQA